jgi:anti-sigma factor RsiW
MRCWWFHFLLARRLDDGRELSRRLAEHVEACPTCRARYEQERRLVERLRTDFHRVRADTPPHLQTRVMARLKVSDASDAEARPAWSWARAVTTAAAVGCVAMIAGSFFRQAAPEPGLETLAPELAEAVRPIRIWAGGATVLSVGADIDEPLENEFRLVMSDARNALGVLSHTFLPKDLAERWK